METDCDGAKEGKILSDAWREVNVYFTCVHTNGL